MRVVFYDEDPGRLVQLLREHGLPERIDLEGPPDGLLVIVVRAHDERVAAAAGEWLRTFPLPDAFIAGCTALTRPCCQTQSWWPATVCDMVAADDDDSLLSEIAKRLERLGEIEDTLASGWLRRRAVGNSPVWRKTLRSVVEVGRFGHGACLLLGQSGCGKEMLARLIHDLDPQRSEGPFVIVDCTTLSPELSGSELFGHAKGAFTHAVAARDGAVALANGGTLFLDEVGELDLPLQARLLRVVQEHTFKRVGEDNWRLSDFRLICATNRDLDADVQAGRFRSDLYFRITQWTVRAPGLAERREDIPLLVRHFLAESGDAVPQVMPEVMQTLAAAGYRGNVRDLRNVVLRIADRQRGYNVLSTGCLECETVDAQTDADTGNWQCMLANAVAGALDAGLGLKNIGQIAESIAVRVAESRAGSTSRAAELLRVTPRALQLRRQVRPDAA